MEVKMSNPIITMGKKPSKLPKNQPRLNRNFIEFIERIEDRNGIRGFTDHEIKFLLSYESSWSVKSKTHYDAFHWFIPLSVYTGMNYEELERLRLDDISLKHGVYVIDLFEHYNLPNDSLRVIPIAQHLLNMGIIDYVKQQKRAGKSLFFEEFDIVDVNDPGWCELDWWFDTIVVNDLLAALSIKDGEQLNFSSIRSSCINKLYSNPKIDFVHAKLIFGHEYLSEDPDYCKGKVIIPNLVIAKNSLDKGLVWGS